MYKINKNIPIPITRDYKKNSKYPFHIMEVGDSFDVSYTEGNRTIISNRLRSACGAAQKRLRRKFITRIIRSLVIVRCWRIE